MKARRKRRAFEVATEKWICFLMQKNHSRWRGACQRNFRETKAPMFKEWLRSIFAPNLEITVVPIDDPFEHGVRVMAEGIDILLDAGMEVEDLRSLMFQMGSDLQDEKDERVSRESGENVIRLAFDASDTKH